MYATWPMVFAALAAGVIGGFVIPDRPQSRPNEVASKAADVPQVIPALRTSDQKPVMAPQVKTPAQPAPVAKESAEGSCARESWPYRAPGCLDRTAALEPGPVVVKAKRTDPAISLRDVSPDKAPAADDGTPAPQHKIVSAPSKSIEEKAERRKPNSRNASTNDVEDSETAPANNRKHKRRSAGRPNFRLVEGEWREEPRVYVRGRDGRLYLAPEYRRVPPSVYYIR
jgi:hypothetical protein